MPEHKRTTRYRHYTYFRGGETSTQFACFQCRKIFKRRISFLRKETERQVCSQCGAKIWFTGTAFKSPRQEDVKQWRKAELLIKSAVLFHPNWGYRPEVLREVAPFLKRARHESDGQRLLSRTSRTKSKNASRSQHAPNKGIQPTRRQKQRRAAEPCSLGRRKENQTRSSSS
jgi:DNA-directed RNA polymerase subunit RPC12/RpoP